MNRMGDVKWSTTAEGFGLDRVRSRRGTAEENVPKVVA
jgi:hypothetical protein